MLVKGAPGILVDTIATHAMATAVLVLTVYNKNIEVGFQPIAKIS